MSKTIFPSREIAHLWAHKVHPSGRNGGDNNFYFRDSTIFSYGDHFAIARHDEHNGRPFVWFTRRGYSVTTSKHLSWVRQAIPDNVPIFYVDGNPSSMSTPAAILREHIDRLTRAAESLEAQTRRQSIVKAWEAFKAVQGEARRFAEFFGLSLDEFPAMSAERVDALNALADARGKAADELRETVQAGNTAARTARELARVKAARKRATAARRTLRENVKKWRKGRHVSLVGLDSVILRVVGPDVETSAGARFPVADALKYLPHVRGIINRRESYTAGEGVPPIRLGPYRVDSIDPAAGMLHAGCHHVPLAEVSALLDTLETARQSAELAAAVLT